MNYWQRWIGAWRKKTAGNTMIERGAYTELLDAYYANEAALPRDLPKVFRMVGAMTKDEQAAVTAVLNEHFDLREDGWHQHRADEELVRWAAFCEQQRRRRVGTTASANPETGEISEPKPKRERVNGASFTPPEWIDREQWDKYIKLRPAKARTADALAAACVKLAEFKAQGHDPNKIVATSLANGWQGLFPPDQAKGGADGQKLSEYMANRDAKRAAN